MKMLRYFLAAIALCLLPVSAQAAVCTWTLGTTGNWDSASSASWDCGHVPTSSDSVVFGASSCTPGPCTITVNDPQGTGTVALTSFTFGACTNTCIIDFSAHNNNVNIINSGGISALSGTGTGTRTLNMGTGTWTIGDNGIGSSASVRFDNVSGLTLTPQPSLAPIKINIGAISSSLLFFGGKSWGALTLTGNATYPSSEFQIESGTNASDTFASVTIVAPAYILFRSAQTFTFTGGITVSGGSWSTPVYIGGDNTAGVSGNVTLASGAVSSIGYVALRNVTGATSTINVNPAVNLGGNGGTLALTNPGTGGSGGYIIGGQ